MSAVRTLLEFLDAPSAVAWDLTPKEALDFMASKGLKPTFDYREMLGEEHARAFTVAKMMDADMLADVKASLDAAQAKGQTFKEWSDTLIPTLQDKGWWGKKTVVDPAGNVMQAQLGSPSRLQTIYRTNMQSAYAAGNWDAIVDQADIAPLLLYDAVDDYRVRPEHAAWDGTLLPVTDDFWKTHYPPNGWSCRCSVIQLSEDEAADLGMTPNLAAPNNGTYTWTNPVTGVTSKIPTGLDPGWNANAGIARAKQLAKVQADKLAAYEAGVAKAAAKGLAAAAEAAKATKAAAQAALEEAAQAIKVAGLAEERAATKAIAKALGEKTPFLAKAIEAVQGTKAGKAMNPKELLTAAKAKAAKTEQDVGIYQWKIAKLAGKSPPAKAQAVVDALPDAKQLELLDGIQAAQEAAQVALAATKAAEAAEALAVAAEQAAAALAADKVLQTAAKAKWDGYKAGTLVEKAAASKFGLPYGVPMTEVLAKVEAEIAMVKASQAAAGIKSATKKALVAGKIPSPAQAKYLADLDPDAKEAFLLEVDKAKVKAGALDPVTGLDAQQAADEAAFFKMEADAAAAAAAKGKPAAAPAKAAPAPAPVAPPAATMDTSGMVQIGPQKGSNVGGLYQDPTTGEKWYIKTPASLDHARNEVLASKLYELNGALLPELRLVTHNGKPSVASRFEDGLEKSTGAKLLKAPGTVDHFAADAWLANWDVAGATMDNLLLKGKQAFRVDVGGSLRYRAQGGAKGADWGPTVRELDSLRDGTNVQTKAVFGKLTAAQMKASAERLLAIDRAAVDALVDQYGPMDLAERALLKATLRARLDDIAKQLGITAKAPEAPAPALQAGGKRITASEYQRITDSRANGYTVSTDGDAIEDHQVLLQHYTDATGKPKTRLVAKLRGQGAAAAEAKASVKLGGAAPEAADLSTLRQALTDLGRSINSRAAKGGMWDATIAQRLENVATERAKVLTQLNGANFATPAAAEAKKVIKELETTVAEWVRNHPSGQALKPIAMLDVTRIPDVKPKVIKAKGDATPTGGLEWQRVKHFEYRTGTMTAGRLTETNASNNIPQVGSVLEGTAPGVRVRFVTDTGQNSVSSRGLVHIDVDGSDLTAAERAIDQLEAMGVITTRTTEGQRVGLYLDKLANLRTLKSPKLEAAYKATEKIKDEALRNAEKLALLNKEAGYDIRKSPHWNPEGKYQAFGHGRTIQMRPDLDGPAMAAFEREHLVYTNVTGLGSSASDDQWNRLLRSIDGGGMLSSQMDRARRGIASTGSSVSSDHQSGGANYVFTRLKKRTATGAGVYFKPSILRRVDAFSYDGDRFGNVSRAVQQSHRAIDVDGFRANASNGSNETNFRDGISLFDDLERIIFKSAAERNRAIADMKARGYKVWPDGRPLEDVLQGPKK